MTPRRRVALAASTVMLPWPIKNWLWIGNPFSPFFNRVFPNPYVHVSFEESYRAYYHSYGIPSLKPLFWLITVTGQLGGQIGPLFLLAPLALLSLRTRPGRHLLLAASIFLIPYPQNIGARFLIPVLPFVALAIAISLEFSRPALAALVVLAGILAWPRVIDRYRAPAGGWQIARMPWQTALGIRPAEKYLEQFSPGYRMARSVNRLVPAGKRVWSSRPVAEAYTIPTVLVYYYSAEGELLEDILRTAARQDMQPLWNLRFTFPPRTVRRLRLLQTATSPGDIWSIGEARFFRGQEEIRPARADAQPFPWDIGLAFDQNPVTRWRSWVSIHPGMHVDVDFGAPVELDRVELACSHDQYKINVVLDGIDAKVEKRDEPAGEDLRHLVTQTVKARGIDYLLIGQDYADAADIQSNPARWGLRRLAADDGDILYQIQ